MLSIDGMRGDIAERLGEPVERIGDHDDLLGLGLDSIGLMRLAARWGKAGSGVTFADLIEHRTLAQWWELILKSGGAHEDGAHEDDAREPVAEPAPEIDETAPFALATMQHAYWVGRTDGQVLGGVGAHFYNEFDGHDVSPERLDAAVRRLVARHPMLRCRFLPDGSQQIMAESTWPGLTVRDLTAVADLDGELERIRAELSHRKLDVGRGQVLDVSLSLLPRGATRVHVQIEMLAADAQSFRTLLGDLAALYRCPGEDLPAIDYSYPRYLAAYAASTRADYERARDYWAGRLAELPGGPELPTAVAPERLADQRITRRYVTVPAERWDRLAARARDHGVTLSMVFLTAFAEALAAWSATDRFVLNLPLYDRRPLHPDVQSLVGDFTSLLLLDADMSGEESFAARATAIQRRFAADVAHSTYSGVEVLRQMARARGAVAAPVVFTSALSLGELFGPDVCACFGTPGWTMSQTPQVWLDCQVTEREGGLFVNWDAVEELFPAGVLDGMFGAFCGLVEWLAEGDWSGPVPVLVPAGQVAVREAVNAGVGSVGGGLLYAGVFEQPADRLAVVGDGVWVTFGELRARALRLAGWLAARGVGAGDAVGVCVPKGVGQVVAVLGVLAAGAVYVPVGVDQPVLRRERIFERAGVRCVVDEAVLAADAEPLSGPVVVPDEQVAYVIFTSGSTGEPKGVEVAHRAAMNTLVDVRRRFGVGPGDRVLAVSALDFDLSVFDIFGLLGVGGAVVVIDEDGRRDPQVWLDLIHRHDVTVWQTVPALLDMLLTAAEDDPGRGLGKLRIALLGGDWVGLDLRERLVARDPGARLIALGGTTETAIHSSVFEVREVPAHWTSIPYGVPLSGQAFRVVDGRGRDCPDLVAGELWIGGASVAEGYRGDPERTAARFVEYRGLRWYRTGDLGRYWPDGTLEFLGRADFQVKIGGHRIELGEIEAVLKSHPGVGDAVVVTVGETTRKLAAALIARGEIAGLEDHLADRLPRYMIPEHVIVLDAFPLSANGKIDRPAVARLLQSRVAAAAVTAGPPRGKVETALAEIWAGLLGCPVPHREASFFALGGDSLLATRLLGRMRRAGLYGGSLRELFEHPRLKDFAALLRPGAPATATAPLEPDPANRYEPFDPTDVQRAYWLGRSAEFALGAVGSHWYWEFDGADVDVDRLERAWNLLIARHEMLRAVFDADGRQRIQQAVPYVTIPVTDGGEDELAEMRERLSARIPDPGRWPLAAIEAVRQGDQVRIAFSFDFIVLDALSIVIVFTELAALYADPGAALPPLGVSFRDYLLSIAPDPADQDYWADRLAELPPPPELPLAVDPGQIGTPRFTRREVKIDAEQWKALRERAREHGVTPASVLATAYAEVLAAWSAQPSLTLNLTLFDRRDVHPDIHRILGDFTSLLLVPHRPQTGDTVVDLVRGLQERIWDGMEHGSVSAIWVLRELARRTGSPMASMPVVFTSALGVSDELAGELPFGRQIWGISQTPQVWLDCQVTEREGGLFVNWDAVEELFPAGVLDGMFGAFCGLVEWLAEGDWSGPVPVLVPAGQVAVREAVNAGVGSVGGGLLYAGVFEQPADRLAVVGDGVSVSFGELRARALRVAGWLAGRGVTAGDAVGVCVPKGVGQVVAVLGVLAAGGVYVPVGVDQPVLRRERIFARAGVRCVVDEAALQAEAEPLVGPVDIGDEQVAYVIFTSGSTGEPKGVEVAHRAAMNTLVDVRRRFGIDAGDRVLAVSALDFDLSVFDIFGLLGVGGAVVVIDEGSRRDPQVWLDLIHRHDVTVWNTVPALLDMLLVTAGDRDLGRLSLALVSGDWVGLDLRERLVARNPGARLIALGGATEAGVWSNFHEVREVPAHWTSIPYGVPLSGQAFRVVDGRGRDCPDLVAGELWIGGASVAEGYRGDPERTAARFVEYRGLRWYRTGDLGRYWPDGTLEFLGRADFQVKIGGHRIELGEIEAVLKSHPDVGDAVVVTVGETTRKLAAALIARGEIAGLEDHLADRLPRYMIPEHVIVLDAFPLSANGKIDRDATARLCAVSEPVDEPPRPGLETGLAAVWAELLGCPPPGRGQSFFALGGDSLLATRLVAVVRDRFGADVPLRDLLARPTVADLAVAVGARLDPDLDHMDFWADFEEGEL